MSQSLASHVFFKSISACGNYFVAGVVYYSYCCMIIYQRAGVIPVDFFSKTDTSNK